MSLNIQPRNPIAYKSFQAARSGRRLSDGRNFAFNLATVQSELLFGKKNWRDNPFWQKTGSSPNNIVQKAFLFGGGTFATIIAASAGSPFGFLTALLPLGVLYIEWKEYQERKSKNQKN